MAYSIDDLVKWFSALVFILLIICDIWKAYSRGAFWIPGKVLVLTALTIQLLGWLEYNTSDSWNLDYDYEVESFVDSMCLARYTLCVFMGYLVTGMASPINRDTWSNTVALFLNLPSHIGKELYVNDQIKDYLKKRTDPGCQKAHEQYGMPFDENSWSPLPIQIRGSLLVLMICLMVLLGLAVVAGKFISRNLSLKIPLIISENEEDVESEDKYLESTKRKMLTCWIVARLCQPEYVLARSGFSAAALGMVTSAIALTSYQFVDMLHYGNELPSTVIIQSVFVVIGWIVIFYRWLNLVFYFPKFKQSILNSWELFAAISRHYHELNDRFFMVISYSKKYVLNKDLPLLWARALVLSPALVVLIIVTVIWKGVWMMILGSSAMTILVTNFFWCLSALVSKVVSKIVNKMLKPMSIDKEFSNYSKPLERIVIPGEDPATLWKANQRYFHQNKSDLEKGYNEGQNCKELIEMVISNKGIDSERSLVKRLKDANELQPVKSVKKRIVELFPSVKEPLWRITAICLLNIMLEVLPLAGENGQEEIQFQMDRAIKAYEQSQDLLDFADCPSNVGVKWNIFGNCNVQSLALRHVADKQTKTIKTTHKQLQEKGLANPVLNTTNEEGDPESIQARYDKVLKSIKNLYDEAKENLEKEYLLGDIPVEKKAYGIYSDWKFVGLNYVMFKVCTIIQDEVSNHSNVLGLFNELSSFFGDVIASCLSDSQDLILKSCKEWAAQFEEEKISSSMFIEGKLLGVMDEVKTLDVPKPSGESISVE